MLQRRTVLLAAVLTLLLGVVAIAARGRPLGSGSSGHGGLPLSFWDYLYTTVVIVSVPILIGVVLAATLVRANGKKRRSYWDTVRMLVFFALFLAAGALILRDLRHRHIHDHQPASPSGVPRGTHGHRQPVPGSHVLRFRWDELLVVVAVLLVVVCAIVVRTRRSRRRSRTGLEPAAEELAAALDESLDDLRADPDLRRAIIAAYARMETALAAAAIPRRPSEAPLEYLERALRALDASAAAVQTLTDLFEWARFSHHEPEPSMRDEAVDALVAVRDELRASELVPA